MCEEDTVHYLRDLVNSKETMVGNEAGQVVSRLLDQGEYCLFGKKLMQIKGNAI